MADGGGCGRVCCRGVYSCDWHMDPRRNGKCSCCWYSVVFLVSLLSLCWMYICLVTFNDREDVNWKVFTILERWVNLFMAMVIVSAVLTGYCVLLLFFALVNAALGEQVNLHWFHRIVLFVDVILVACAVTGVSLKWKQEWPTVPLSLQATGPFLQFGAVGALTLLSSFVFQCILRSRNAGPKVFIASVFGAVSAAIFLSPLLIDSPCLIEGSELPEKPKFYGHRGAPMKAPENTLMSFNRSIECGVAAFETDVQLSKDRIPFLMHDSRGDFLLRTTNVKEKFPGKRFNHSSYVTWDELQSLNAGEWFLKTDPFLSVGSLSEEEKKSAQNQTIPSLRQLLDLAQRHSISVMFDLYSTDQESDTNDTVATILASGIDASLILWLQPNEREAVSLAAPGFVQVYNDVDEMLNKSGTHLNMKYSNLSTKQISDLRSRNKTVNLWVVNEPWLFSLLWCAGASSVTTNSCHRLRDMAQPNWTMSPGTYRIIWIVLDVSSILVMAGLFALQRKREARYESLDRERTVPFLAR